MRAARLFPHAFLGFLLIATPCWADDPVNAVEGSRLPDMLVTQIVEKFPENAGFPFAATLLDAAGEPAAGASVTISWGDGSLEAAADQDGRIEFTALPEIITEVELSAADGITVEFDAFTPQSLRVNTTAEKPDPPVVVKSGAGTLEVETLRSGDGLVVRHTPDDAALAKRVMQELSEIRSFLAGALNFEVSSREFGATLDRGDGLGPDGLAIPMPAKEWEKTSGLARWVTIHEWVEFTLMASISYRDDPELRWVGDGIAEFASLSYCMQHAPEEAKRRIKGHLSVIKKLRREGIERVDLADLVGRGTSQDHGGRIGEDSTEPLLYAVSMLRWTECERAAPGSAASIIAKIQAGELPDAASCAAAISDASKLTDSSLSLDEIEAMLKKIQRSI